MMDVNEKMIIFASRASFLPEQRRVSKLEPLTIKNILFTNRTLTDTSKY